MARTRGGRRRLLSMRIPSITYPTLTLQEVQDITKNDQWIIKSIIGQSYSHHPINPDFCFFVDWQDSSWDTSNATINSLMQSKVCPLRTEPHQKFLLTFMHVTRIQPQSTDQRLPRSRYPHSH